MAAKRQNSDDKKRSDMALSKDDPDFWDVDRANKEGFVLVFDAKNKEVAPGSCSITAFNSRTGWVERIDKTRIVNDSRPRYYEQYQSPLQALPIANHQQKQG